MVTIYKNPAPEAGAAAKPAAPAHPMKQDIDTRIPPKARPVLDEIRINGTLIPEADILAEAQNHPANDAQEALLQAARALVIRELLWQEASRLGLAAVADESLADHLPETPVDAAIGRLVEQEVTPPQATEEDCRRMYERAPERFTAGALVEARHILLAANPKDPQARSQARETAVALIAELEADMGRFSALAQEFSACSSAGSGGSLGQLPQGSTVPEFEKALKKAAEGLIKVPVETRYGYHIVDIVHKIDGTPLPFEAVKERIAAWLEASSWSRAVAQYITLLAGKADIKGINILPTDGTLVQ